MPPCGPRSAPWRPASSPISPTRATTRWTWTRTIAWSCSTIPPPWDPPMRAWLPEARVTGPERPVERDIEGLNRVFAEAFTDRYRRDGLIGVRVPQLNPLVWRYALLDAGEGAMVWRDEHGAVAASHPGPHAGGGGVGGPPR